MATRSTVLEKEKKAMSWAQLDLSTRALVDVRQAIASLSSFYVCHTRPDYTEERKTAVGKEKS